MWDHCRILWSVVDRSVFMRRIPVLKCGWDGLFGWVIRQWMDGTMFILKCPHQLWVPPGAGCFRRRCGGRNLEILLDLLPRPIMIAAQNGPFRKHYFNHPEDSLMMAPLECRNIWEKLNKDRPTLCHLLYYFTIYCSTCFEC